MVKVNLELVKELREKNGYSISDMSQKTGFKTPTGYWLIEQGQRKVSVETLYILSELYGIAMEDMLTKEN